jgi:hypothetical protein
MMLESLQRRQLKTLEAILADLAAGEKLSVLGLALKHEWTWRKVSAALKQAEELGLARRVGKRWVRG